MWQHYGKGLLKRAIPAVALAVELAGYPGGAYGATGITYTDGNGLNVMDVSGNGSVVLIQDIAGVASGHALMMHVSGNGSTTFYDIGTLGGSSSTAAAISDNGSVAIGWSDTSGNTGSHAFRASSADGYSIHDLGTLGGSDSGANDVNRDGSVIVGWSTLSDNVTDHAFRWTEMDGVMHDLGTLGGSYSEATSVSGDGAVVAGISFLAGDADWHAFRWQASDDTMADLGTLGGSDSWARYVNLDGSVVVGQSDITGNTGWHAFRWTASDSTMADLGTLGGDDSWACAVTEDGSIVVGESNLSSGTDYHAFFWTASDSTMHDLGTLGGNQSWASDVNRDGSVVVGWSEIFGDASGKAFRWTEATGMQSVEEWLVANGGDNLASDDSLVAAYFVSDDGNVVVGEASLSGIDQVFIARVSEETAPGVLGMSDFLNSLSLPTVAGAVLHERMRSTVSSDPQNSAPQKGQFALSAQGIYDGYSDSSAGGDGASGVFKVIYGASDSLRVGLGITRAEERLDMDDNGAMQNEVDIFEGLFSYGDYTGDGWRCGFSVGYGNGDANLIRRYPAGADSAQSSGEMAVEQYGYAMEVGYGFLVTPDTLITPVAGYEWVESELDSYTEPGGPFPAHFDERTLSNSYARAGVKVEQRVSPLLDLEVDADYVLRLSDPDAPVSGSLIGLGTMGAFSREVELSRDWLEFRAGIDYVPEFISKDLHLRLGFQLDLGQEFDLPAYRVDTGLVIFF